MVVVPAPMSITAAPRSASSSASAESPATYGLATIASTSRWQRSIASIRLRAADDVGGDDMHVDAELRRPSMPRGSRIPPALSSDVADRQRMQHGAAGTHRMAAAGGQHAGDVALGDRPRRDLDRGRDELAGRACRRRPRPSPSRAASRRCARRGRRHWRTAASGLGKIDHRAGLHAARKRVAEADDVDRMGAPAQHVLRRPRLEAPDQAGDLAGADIERGDQHRTASAISGFIFGVRPNWRALMRAPFFFGLRPWPRRRACAAASESRTVTRSGSRRSMATISRVIRFFSLSSATSRSSARAMSVSGSRTSMPLFSRRFQRRSPTRTAARTKARSAG